MSGTDLEARVAYDDWHQRFAVDTAADTPWHEMVKRSLRPERDLAGKRVLEIGSGRGGFACWLASQTPAPRAVVAADFARSAVTMGRDYARSAGIGAVSWEVGDIQWIAHQAGSFDTVISCETVEHLPDPARAIRELARVLKPGGRLFLTTPNYVGPMGLYRLYLRLAGRPYTEEGQPINRLVMLPRTLWWVNRAGLDIVATRGVGHYLPLPGSPWQRFAWMDSVPLAHLVALHSLVEARKP